MRISTTWAWKYQGRLPPALSGRPQAPQARGRRKLKGALAARRSEACHGPLDRVVRCSTAHLCRTSHYNVSLRIIPQGKNMVPLFHESKFPVKRNRPWIAFPYTEPYYV